MASVDSEATKGGVHLGAMSTAKRRKASVDSEATKGDDKKPTTLVDDMMNAVLGSIIAGPTVGSGLAGLAAALQSAGSVAPMEDRQA